MWRPAPTSSSRSAAASRTIEGLRALREACGVPLSLQILGWLETDLAPKQIESVAGLATFRSVALMSATQAMRTNLRALAEAKSSRQLPLAVTGLHDFNDFIGFSRVDALQKKYMVGEQA